MRKLLAGIVCACIAIALAMATVCTWSMHMRADTARLYTERENALSLVGDDAAKYRGLTWTREAAKHGALMFFGSSELSSTVPPVIKSFFPNVQLRRNISCSGRAHMQNFEHALAIGANSEALHDADIVIFESLQWFFGDDIPIDGFMANFSEQHFQEFLNNPRISTAAKTYACKRFLALEKRRTSENIRTDVPESIKTYKIFRAREKTLDYPQTHLLARSYLDHTFMGNVIAFGMQPYFAARGTLLRLKDEYAAWQAMRNADPYFKRPLFDCRWQEKFTAANALGERTASHNPIHADDIFFKEHVEKNWDNLKDSSKGATALVSREWDDYVFLLGVCRELGLTPYIVLLPTNGHYYDHVGVDPKMRQLFYQRNAQTAYDYGIPVFSGMKDREYEHFLFYDEIHLSQKGWLYVAKAIIEHFK